MDLNKMELIWNITSDIELKTTPNWQIVCNFSVATNRTWKDSAGMKQEEVEFHSCILWGRLAEICHDFCHKWSKIFLCGRLKTRVWEDQEWKKRYKTEIIWDNLIILSWKKEDSKEKDDFKDSDKKHWITPDKKQKPKVDDDPMGIEDIPF